MKQFVGFGCLVASLLFLSVYSADYTLPSRVVLQSRLSISQKGGSDLWYDPNYQPELFQLVRIRKMHDFGFYNRNFSITIGYNFL